MPTQPGGKPHVEELFSTPLGSGDVLEDEL